MGTAGFMTFDWVCHKGGSGEKYTQITSKRGHGAMCFCDNEPKIYRKKSLHKSGAQKAYAPPGTKAYIAEYYTGNACKEGNTKHSECLYVYPVSLHSGKINGHHWVMF